MPGYSSVTTVWETEQSHCADCHVHVDVDDCEEIVAIEVIGVCHVGVALSFEEWDAIVAAVAKAREEGGR